MRRRILLVSEEPISEEFYEQTLGRMRGWGNIERVDPDPEKVLNALGQDYASLVLAEWSALVGCILIEVRESRLNKRRRETPFILFSKNADTEMSRVANEAGWTLVAVTGEGPLCPNALAAKMRVFSGWGTVYLVR